MVIIQKKIMKFMEEVENKNYNVKNALNKFNPLTSHLYFKISFYYFKQFLGKFYCMFLWVYGYVLLFIYVFYLLFFYYRKL